MIATILRGLRAPGPITLTSEAGAALISHGWPFNIRELAQRIERARVASKGQPMTNVHLGLNAATLVRASGSPASPSAKALSAADAKLKRELLASLELHNGNLAGVARSMGKARMQIQRWIKRFNIDTGTFRRERR